MAGAPIFLCGHLVAEGIGASATGSKDTLSATESGWAFYASGTTIPDVVHPNGPLMESSQDVGSDNATATATGQMFTFRNLQFEGIDLCQQTPSGMSSVR
jgi:hypothetical protein